MKDWRCQQLLVELFHRLDGKEFDLLVDLFDEEGSWRRPTALLRGRAEIASAMAKRSATAVTRHLVSNFLVIEDRGEEVDAVASLTTYSIDSGEHRELPIAVEAPLGVFRASATFRCAGAKTSILRLDLRPELTIGKPNCHR